MDSKTFVVYDHVSYNLFYRSEKAKDQEKLYPYYVLDEHLDVKRLRAHLNQFEFESIVLCVMNGDDIDDGAALSFDGDINFNNNNNNIINANNNNNNKNKLNNTFNGGNKEITFKDGKYNNVIKTLLDYLRGGIQRKYINNNNKNNNSNHYLYNTTPRRIITPKLGIILITNEDLDGFGMTNYIESNIEVNMPFLYNIKRLCGLDIVSSTSTARELNNRIDNMLRENAFHWNYDIVMPRRVGGHITKDNFYPVVSNNSSRSSSSGGNNNSLAITMMLFLIKLLLATTVLFFFLVVLNDFCAKSAELSYIKQGHRIDPLQFETLNNNYDLCKEDVNVLHQRVVSSDEIISKGITLHSPEGHTFKYIAPNHTNFDFKILKSLNTQQPSSDNNNNNNHNNNNEEVQYFTNYLLPFYKQYIQSHYQDYIHPIYTNYISTLLDNKQQQEEDKTSTTIQH
ncbi:hypothetical protein PPL_00182 [Heterostelium album PN500]|uniref:Uncharacterized protein n=1 Tax=Heterostelium pallidum (strain ATCC 26659 / Pp 5 / PN500) TaxID=670386 RepID=D3AVR7_HETP5|nr:hypothetical protein PPL_00182 [Heterostelium album PN500]EFA86390.1 hypothetical protein PPL_00182 [Heterostelium album PN500]|eukprot:XP_020438495.1 hypothetical protein PPL_00182 [Heterostelium album PN500]